MVYPRPLIDSRVVVVDWGKGFAILVMVLLHLLSSVVPPSGDDIGAIINGVLQLMNGLFFFFSGFGNFFSVKKMLLKEQQGRTSAAWKAVVLRGFWMIIISIVFLALFHGFLRAAIFAGFRASFDAGEHWADEWRSHVFSPEVVPFIGFSVMLCGLLSISIDGRATKHGWSLRRRMWTYVGAASSIHVVSILLRALLDRATCGESCVGDTCRAAYNQTDLALVNVPWPQRCYTTTRKRGDFQGDGEWDPCASVGADEPVFNVSLSNGYTPNFEHDAKQRCERFVREWQGSLDGASFAHLSNAARGLRWCPTSLARDGLSPSPGDAASPLLEQCLLIPWWAPPHQQGGMRGDTDTVWARTNGWQHLVHFLLWPWLGRYGFFAYGATTLIGQAAAAYVSDQEGGWTPTLFRRMYLLGLLLLTVGAYPALGLFFLSTPDNNEGTQMASTPVRFFIGGLEVLVFTGFAHSIEGRPRSGCRDCCGSACGGCPSGCCGTSAFSQSWFYKVCRLFGMVSFTVYTLHLLVMDIVTATLNAVGGFNAPWCFRGLYPHDANATRTCEANDGRVDSALVLLYIAVNFAVWVGLLSLWKRCGFVGSLEWLTQAVLARARGGGAAKSNAINAFSDVRLQLGDHTSVVEVSCADVCCPCCFGHRRATRGAPMVESPKVVTHSTPAAGSSAVSSAARDDHTTLAGE
jgi:hypothetical protein